MILVSPKGKTSQAGLLSDTGPTFADISKILGIRENGDVQLKIEE